MFDTATGRWVKAGTTKGDETQTVVNGLIPGHEYKFRVSAVNAEGQSEPLETAGKIIAKEPFDTPGKPGKPVEPFNSKHKITTNKWLKMKHKSQYME